MRLFCLLLIALSTIACSTTRREAPKNYTIDDILPRYIEEQQFKRISEYLTGKEHSTDRLIIRSEPSVRTGQYFVLILNENVRTLPKGTKIIGEFFKQSSTDVVEISLTLPNRRASTKEIFFGLTGKDFPEDAAIPAAWRFTIEGPNGDRLAVRQSYLWSL